MTLVDAISLAQDRNAEELAKEINAPKPKLDDTESLIILRGFAGWARSAGLKWLPATPATCAAWIRFQQANKVPAETIAKAITAIEVLHDQYGHANPIATAAVRAELGRILEVKPPRSWGKKNGEDLVFNTLPIEARLVIKRHAEFDSLAIRKIQNRFADLEANLQKKGTNEDVQVST
jgi:hypothetical protein